MAKRKEEKTNVMRILDKRNIPYQAYFYEHDAGAVDGVTVAALLNQNAAQVFKTLVTRGLSGNVFVFVLPVAKELDLKLAARSVGEKSVAMLPVSQINVVTGYVRGGCSPIGMAKSYRTVVDESCADFNSIIFSGGKIGTQVQVSSVDLLELINASTAALTCI